MGNCCPIFRFRRRQSAVNRKSVTLLLVGLDNAGKTTIARRLAEEPLDGIMPTVGFSRVTLREKGCSVTVYDLGGGPQIRDIWPRYYADVHGVIFVVDASDIARMTECRKALEGVLLDGFISGKPILLLANKQDVEGALDEIDVVDRLNLERLVNRQRCPTLVELCSARHFSRKMDVGIDNGYKWLLRCISKDYPLLNNRVLKDSATQEELERINRMKRMERILRSRERESEVAEIQGNSFESVRVSEDDFKPHRNGVIKMVDEVELPGQIRDVPISRMGVETDGKPRVSRSGHEFRFDTEFFICDSDLQLIRNIEDGDKRKNFLMRPKSSGPRLAPMKSESTRRRRRSFHKNNKTAPNPMTELSLEALPPPPGAFRPVGETEMKVLSKPSGDEENRPPRAARDLRPKMGESLFVSKSTPNSRSTSAKSARKKRPSSDQMARLSKLGRLPPLKVPGRASAGKELVLDVTQLDESL